MNWKDGQGTCRGKRGVLLRTGGDSGRSSLRWNGESTANWLGNLFRILQLEATASESRQSHTGWRALRAQTKAVRIRPDAPYFSHFVLQV